jgi:hypothetical protein
MNGYKLVIYSNDSFVNRAQRLKDMANGCFDEVFHYTEDELRKTEFFKENKHILTQKRGAGYWLWKPYILLETIKKCVPTDKILYLDCGDIFRPDNINEVMDGCLCDSDLDLCLTYGACPTKQFTKRDCFVYMDCDTAEYHNSVQIEAGMIVFKPTEYTQNIFSEWLSFCKDERILTDIPNTCGKDNFPEFLDHRHDQSVLNLLSIRHGLKISNSIRGSVFGNYCQTD